MANTTVPLGAIKVTGIETIILAFPTEKPIADALHVFQDRGAVITEVKTDAGISGWGFSYFGTIAGGPRTLKYLIDQELAPLVIGEDPFDSRKIRAKLWKEIEYQGVAGITHFGFSAIDVALWDICGKAVGLPVHKLLGSCHDRMPIYAMVGWYYGSEKEYADICEKVVKQGFRAVKLKVGSGSLEDDIKRIKLARKVVGEGIHLMVDANQTYTLSEAIRRGRAYQDYDLFWFEEPFPPQFKEQYAELKSALDIPIATGENDYTRFAFADLLQKGRVDIVQPDLRRAGGVLEWLDIGSIAEVFGARVASHGGGLPELNILCAMPNAFYMETAGLDESVTFPEKMILENGAILAPRNPGMGSEPHPDMLKFRVA